VLDENHGDPGVDLDEALQARHRAAEAEEPRDLADEATTGVDRRVRVACRRPGPALVQDQSQEARQPGQDLVGRRSRIEEEITVDGAGFDLAEEALEQRKVPAQERGRGLFAREGAGQPPQVVVRGMFGP
jgi:hypothetical protein